MPLTIQRDLRTGLSLWSDLSHPRLNLKTQRNTEKFDVIVVGTGISGALTADALLNAGYSVLAVDRRKPMSGSTAASTALLQSELDLPLTKLIKRLGRSDAARAWQRSADCVTTLCNRIDDLGIACDFSPRSTIYLPGNVLSAEGLREETTARQKLGLRSTFLDRKTLHDLNGIRAAGAIRTQGNAEVDPLKLVTGIWRAFLRRGGKMLANTEIVDVDETRNHVRLNTREGELLQARWVVFCTGYEQLRFVKPKGYKIISTWVLATKQQPEALWREKSLIWQAADPYLYLRTTHDGRVIVGGEDEEFSDEATRDKATPGKIARIAKKAAKIFPRLDFEAAYSWAGCFGESATSLPAVGLIKGFARSYSVLGFGGNGITFSMMAAQLISRHIQGLNDPDAELFRL